MTENHGFHKGFHEDTSQGKGSQLPLVEEYQEMKTFNSKETTRNNQKQAKNVPADANLAISRLEARIGYQDLKIELLKSQLASMCRKNESMEQQIANLSERFGGTACLLSGGKNTRQENVQQINAGGQSFEYIGFIIICKW